MPDAKSRIAVALDASDRGRLLERCAEAECRKTVFGNLDRCLTHAVDPVISKDGRFIAFRSLASNIVAGDSNDGSDVFVFDRVRMTSMRASVDSAGNQVVGDSSGLGRPAISATGIVVAFDSDAAGLVADDVGAIRHIFVHEFEMSPLAVTLTPGSGAFWSSVTTPRMAPVSRDWENASGANRRAMARNVKICFLNPTSFFPCLGDKAGGRPSGGKPIHTSFSPC